MVSAGSGGAGRAEGCPCARPHRGGPNRISRPTDPDSSPSLHTLGVPGDSGTVLSHGSPERPWRASSWARGPGGAEGEWRLWLKPFPGSGMGRGASAVPRLQQPAASGREVSPRPSVVGSGAGTASDGPGAGVARECCFWGVFRGFLREFNFSLLSCHVPQVPYLFHAFIYSSLTKVWSVLTV